MKNVATPQEKFWKGNFGDKYVRRNLDEKLDSANLIVFGKILSKTSSVSSLLELGAGAGNNLLAIRKLLPKVRLAAVEINKTAAKTLKNRIKNVDVKECSIFKFNPKEKFDFVLSKGVLIHINPTKLKNVYDLMYSSSKKYICLIEYYNPTPVDVEYRGQKGYLFKRDFAGEMLETFKNLRLVGYGFFYHRDNNFLHSDLNWFLLEKTK